MSKERIDNIYRMTDLEMNLSILFILKEGSIYYPGDSSITWFNTKKNHGRFMLLGENNKIVDMDERTKFEGLRIFDRSTRSIVNFLENDAFVLGLIRDLRLNLTSMQKEWLISQSHVGSIRSSSLNRGVCTLFLHAATKDKM